MAQNRLLSSVLDSLMKKDTLQCEVSTFTFNLLYVGTKWFGDIYLWDVTMCTCKYIILVSALVSKFDLGSK